MVADVQHVVTPMVLSGAVHLQERVMCTEAVHRMQHLEELKRRLQQSDRSGKPCMLAATAHGNSSSLSKHSSASCETAEVSNVPVCQECVVGEKKTFECAVYILLGA